MVVVLANGATVEVAFGFISWKTLSPPIMVELGWEPKIEPGFHWATICALGFLVGGGFQPLLIDCKINRDRLNLITKHDNRFVAKLGFYNLVLCKPWNELLY